MCVFGEANTFQEGEIQVIARHAEQAVKGQGCGTTSRVIGIDIQQKLGKKHVHRIVRRQAPPRTAAQPDGEHGEQAYWMSCRCSRLGPGSLDE